MTLRDRLFLFASAVGNRLAALWVAVNSKAPLDSPFFTGTPKTSTPQLLDDPERLATLAYVANAIGAHPAQPASADHAGTMSSEDFVKLGLIEPEANLYIHPASHSAWMIATESGRQFCSQAEKDAWNDQLELGETSTTACRGDLGMAAYNHAGQLHAPVDAQKNSDILKEEIEAVLTGLATGHHHDPDTETLGWLLPINMSIANGSEIYHLTQISLPAGTWELFYEVQFQSTASGNEHYVAGVRQEIAAAYTSLASGQTTGYGLSGHFAKISGRVELVSTGNELFYLYGACLVGGAGKSITKSTSLLGLNATSYSAKRIR